MQPPKDPKNEKLRQLSVEALDILDSPKEKEFDKLTHYAVGYFNVPISTITIIDNDREWYKSCQGLTQREGSRAASFCGHAILHEEIFVVPDTTKDPRFTDNPMVIGEPYIRFYAGVPIVDRQGYKLGAFCIKDIRPRNLTLKEMDELRLLARKTQDIIWEMYQDNS